MGCGKTYAPEYRRYRMRSWLGWSGLMALVALPLAFYQALGNFDQPETRWVALASTVFSVSLLTAIAMRHWRITWYIATLLALLALPHALFLAVYHAPIDANALALLPETNPSDAWEMIRAVPAVIWLLPFAPILASWAAWPRPVKMLDKRTSMRATCISIACLTFVYATVWINQPAFPEDHPTMRFPLPPTDQGEAWRGAYPLGLAWTISDVVTERRALSDATDYLRTYRFGANRSVLSRERRVFVLVIGEASRADRWHVNGYDRPTTPKLSARDDVISFTRLYSPWSYSRLAVPLILTRKPTTSTSSVFGEASIITAFKEAGFTTAWISLKPALGFHASPVTVHSSEADQKIFLNLAKEGKSVKPDITAVDTVNQLMRATKKDLFIVIHTMGSHFDYRERYESLGSLPFQPDRPTAGRARLFESSDKSYLSNSYDNSIVATDAFLSSLIEMLEERDDLASWMYYVSDHGEALFDDCRGLSGHVHTAYHTQHAAAILWTSARFHKARISIVEQITRNRQLPLSISYTFETLSDLGGINVPGRRPGHSIAASDVHVPTEAMQAEQDLATACRAAGAEQHRYTAQTASMAAARDKLPH